MNTDQNRAADALDQWWDAWQHGEITDGIPTPDMHLIQEITAMHAHAISTADERRIWQQTMAQIRERQERTVGPMDRLLRVTIPWPESHWFPSKLTATAVLVLMIVASLVINLRSGDDRHNPAIFAPGDATPIATPASQGTPVSGVPMLRSDAARTGAIPDHGPASQPSQLWAYPGTGAVNALPAIANGVLYVGTDDGVEHALSLTTGAEIWSFDTGVPGHVVPTVGTEYIFTTTEDGQIIAQDKATGAEIWRHGQIRGFTSPALVGSEIYVDGQGGGGYLLDQKTGAEVAHFITPLDLSHSASVDSEVAYGPTSDGTMHAIEIDSGTELWKTKLTERNLSSPAISDGTLFVAETNDAGFGALMALDQATGTQKWRFETEKRLALTQPAVFNGVVYTGGRDGAVYAVNAADGSLKWKSDTPTHYLISAAPSIADGVLYVGAGDGQIYAMDAATGETRWQVTIDGGTGFGPIVADGTLCVVTQTGKVILFGSAPGATPEPYPQ